VAEEEMKIDDFKRRLKAVRSLGEVIRLEDDVRNFLKDAGSADDGDEINEILMEICYRKQFVYPGCDPVRAIMARRGESS